MPSPTDENFPDEEGTETPGPTSSWRCRPNPTRTSPTKRGLKHRPGAPVHRASIADENFPDEEGTETRAQRLREADALLPDENFPDEEGTETR